MVSVGRDEKGRFCSGISLPPFLPQRRQPRPQSLTSESCPGCGGQSDTIFQFGWARARSPLPPAVVVRLRLGLELEARPVARESTIFMWPAAAAGRGHCSSKCQQPKFRRCEIVQILF